MKFLSLLAASIASLASTTASPHAHSKPSKTACSMKKSAPCSCPKELYYYETTTIGIVGATMADSRALMNDFYNTSWYAGALPTKTQGPDNTPGSIRTFDFTDSTGIYSSFSEILKGFKVDRDGSFLQQYQQYVSPEAERNGTVPGFYVRLGGTPTFVNETVITITAWGCWQGEHPGLAASHDQGLNNAISILKEEGKLTGVTPSNFISTEYFAD